MTIRNINIILFTAMILVLLVSSSSFGQRKKKPDGAQASEANLREAEFYFTEGEKFFILEDYSKALLYYQRALELAPGNATIHYKIAEVLAQSNRQEDMVKSATSIENALRLERKNKYFYLLAANIYYSLGRFDKAAEAYEAMITEVKGTEEYLYELAVVYQYGNKQDDALKTYQRAESLMGINEVASTQKQKILFEQGRTKEAIAEGEKLIKAFPHEERYVMTFAEMLSQRNMKNEAIQYLENFIVNNGDAGNSKMLLAGLYREINQEEKARPMLLSLFANDDVELSSKLIVLGIYNAELNRNKAANNPDKDKENFAVTLLEKLIKAYPNEPNVFIVGGDLYLSTGRNREAQQEYLKAINAGEVNFEVWENLLYLEVQQEQYDLVIKHSDQALELFPNQAILYYFNGFANLRKKRYQESIGSLEQAKKLNYNNTSLQSEIAGLLGDAYNALRDYGKSDAAYDEALTLNPNNNAVLNNYSYFLSLRKINLEKAEKLSAQLVKNNPDNATYLDTHAWVLYTRGKYKEAKKMMERAISTGRATATHLEHYGDILYKNGDVEGAVQQWEKARGLNANSETLNKKISNRKIYE